MTVYIINTQMKWNPDGLLARAMLNEKKAITFHNSSNPGTREIDPFTRPLPEEVGAKVALYTNGIGIVADGLGAGNPRTCLQIGDGHYYDSLDLTDFRRYEDRPIKWETFKEFINNRPLLCTVTKLEGKAAEDFWNFIHC
jgi:hypothetical protein